MRNGEHRLPNAGCRMSDVECRRMFIFVSPLWLQSVDHGSKITI